MVNIEYLHLLTPACTGWWCESIWIWWFAGQAVHFQRIICLSSPSCWKEKFTSMVYCYKKENVDSLSSTLNFCSRNMQLSSFESSHFKWHFPIILLCANIRVKKKKITSLKTTFLSLPVIFFSILFLSWGSSLNKAVLFTWIIRPQRTLQCNILLASKLDQSQL